MLAPTIDLGLSWLNKPRRKARMVLPPASPLRLRTSDFRERDEMAVQLALRRHGQQSLRQCAAPAWAESQLLAPVKVAVNTVQRVTFAIPTSFAGFVFLHAGRLGTTPGSGLIMQLSRMPWYGSGPNRIVEPHPLYLVQDVTTAGVQTQLATTLALTDYASLTVTNATNANPIVITTSTNHGYSTGDVVTIASVGGNTNANTTAVITVLSATTFSLNGVSGNAAYTSGGTCQLTNGTTVTSGTGVAAGIGQANQVMLADSNSAPSNCEFHRISRVASTTNTYFAEPMTHVVTTSWYLSTYAMCSGPIAITGGATAQSGNTNQINFEAIFDNGAEGTVAYFVEAYLQQLNTIA